MTPNILIVEARFYDAHRRRAARRRDRGAGKAGAQFERITVPGALEIPPAILLRARGGEHGGKAIDGYVALGCVIRGETYHFEIVASESRARADGSRPATRALHRQRHPDRRGRESRRWSARAARRRRQGRRCRARLPGADRASREPLGARPMTRAESAARQRRAARRRAGALPDGADRRATRRKPCREFTEHRFGREAETGTAGETDAEFFDAHRARRAAAPGRDRRGRSPSAWRPTGGCRASIPSCAPSCAPAPSS